MSEQLAYNIDCMEYMKTVPDKYFDLAVVDPPYGGGAKADANESFNGSRIGRFGGHFDKYLETEKPNPPSLADGSQSLNVERERACTVEEQTLKTASGAGSADGLTATISVARTGGKWATKYQVGGVFSKDIRHWDIAPSQEYFDELARISKNQIIWGGNYFHLPPTRCFLIWRKLTISENFTMAMAEYAWTSFNDNAKVFEYAPQNKNRTHPTEKPIALYEWIFKRYAHKGDRIFDSHLGSGTSRMAAYNLDLDFIGCEIDKIYFDIHEKRWAEHTAQARMIFEPPMQAEQETINFD